MEHDSWLYTSQFAFISPGHILVRKLRFSPENNMTNARQPQAGFRHREKNWFFSPEGQEAESVRQDFKSESVVESGTS